MHKDDLKKGILELVAKAEMHGYEIQRQLASKGFTLHYSYLYKVLSEMQKEGYLECSQVKSTFGPKKKVFRVGKKGSEELDRALKEAVKIIHVKYMDYLAKLPSEKSILRKMQLLLNVQMGKQGKILIVAPRTFYNWMITTLCEKFSKGVIYLIKPNYIKLNVGCENLHILDATPSNILLKDNFVDAVRVHGEPEDFPEAIKEFHRVLKQDGSLALIIPFFHSTRGDRPLTFAEFVEKVEHEASGEDKSNLDHEKAKFLLSRFFRKVKCYHLAHLAIFITQGKIVN